MEHELSNVGDEWRWKDVPDRQRWTVAWGVLWRIWVISAGVYATLLVVALVFIAIAAAVAD